MSLPSEYVPKLPEVGAPLLDAVAKIHDTRRRRAELLRQAEALSLEIVAMEVALGQKTRIHWTAAEIDKARS